MSDIDFFVGLHQPSDAGRFVLACISIRRLWKRKKPLGLVRVLVDSGAFMELLLHGEYRESVQTYASELHRLHTCGVVTIAAAVAQDYMCEDFMLARTRATDVALAELDGLGPAPRASLIALHQLWTIERYDALLLALKALFPAGVPFQVMPVLQGYAPTDYARHIAMYGGRLKRGALTKEVDRHGIVTKETDTRMWVGVGSVCKRNSDPSKIAAVLRAILGERPDLRLHGFGVKLTSLLSAEVRDLIATADSMAWSYSARKQGRSANDWREAAAFVERVTAAIELPRQPYQLQMFEDAA